MVQNDLLTGGTSVNKQWWLERITPEPATGCWLWLGALSKNGYGKATVNGESHYAHRLSFAFHVGAPVNSLVLHRCDVRCCVNPIHLWLGTHADNMRDSVLKGRHHYASLTQCKRGHALSAENVRNDKRGRTCRTCERMRQKGLIDG